MDLLLSSKRTWLLSYLAFEMIEIILIIFGRESSIGKTAIILIGIMQGLILLFFAFIVFFEWKRFCRSFLTLLYLGCVICLSINHIISRWYIIIPLSIVLVAYMFWNIGGVVNCIVAVNYKDELDSCLKQCHEFYNNYKEKVEKYNTRNNSEHGTEFHIKKEPDWYGLCFDSTGVQMFGLFNSFFGISISIKKWNQKIAKIEKISFGLANRCEALDTNTLLFEEREILGRIRDKRKGISDKDDLLEQEEILNNTLETNRKKVLKILKKRL